MDQRQHDLRRRVAKKQPNMAAVRMKPLRVEKTGQVYRKLFEAEVSLVKSLANERNPPPVRLSKKTLPLMRPLDEDWSTKTGILTSKQRDWANALPNDSKTGIPATKASADSREELTGNTEDEVRGLPDVVRPASRGTDVALRIETNRKERHDAAVNQLHSELSNLSTEFEARVAEIASQLKDRLSGNDKDIEEIFYGIESDEALVSYSFDDLSCLWDEVMAQSHNRQSSTLELDDVLESFEQQRTKIVEDVFKYYTAHLEAVAYLVPSDVIRLMASEAQMINSSILSNRRTYANMIGALLAANVERERRYHDWWLNRLADWKVLNCELSQRMFGDFMNSPAVLSPPEINKLISFMTAKQQAMNKRRLDLLHQFGKLCPPSCTKTAIYGWNSSMRKIQEDLGTLHERYIRDISDHQTMISDHCMEEMERRRMILIEAGVCTEQTASEVITQGFLPMVEERKRQAEMMVEDIKRSLNALVELQAGQAESLFLFGQGAAHLWDEHQVTLKEQRKAMQEEVGRCRENHDTANQQMEVDLDVIMDRMRQDASEEALSDHLKQALAMLDTIKESYAQFHDEMGAKVRGYPSMVQAVLVSYDGNVLKYFSVDRKPIGKKKKGTKSRLKVDSRHSSTGFVRSASSHSAPREPVPQEVVSLPNGTTFFVLTAPGEHGIQSPDSTFLTESGDVGGSGASYAWTDGIAIPENLFAEVRKGMRNEFLEHLEHWKEEAAEKARKFVSVKEEELKGELDLRLHLHQPRSRRAEIDIHNVRAGELVSHQSRLRQHMQGTVSVLNEKKAVYSSLVALGEIKAEEFREKLEALLEKTASAERTQLLVEFQKQANDDLKLCLTAVQSRANEFRGKLKNTINGLRSSNADFRKSLILFADKGNFCSEEVEQFELKLDKISRRIDTVGRALLVESESAEKKRSEKYAETFRKWEERFRHHFFDLKFVEKVQRFLTNVQVKIKSEVAASNSQTKALAEELTAIERRCDAIEHPNPDKEQISARELMDSIPAVFTLCRERVPYLECSIHGKADEPSLIPAVEITVTFDDASDVATKVVGGGGGRISRASTSTLPQEPISAINLTRNILKQSCHAKTLQPQIEQHQSSSQSLTAIPRPPPPTDLSAKMVSRSLPGEVDKLKATRSSAGSRLKGSQAGKKVEKRLDSFGGAEKDDPKAFLPRIRTILVSAQTQLFSKCEIFYKQKGSRALTRPELIYDTVEQCTEALNGRLQSYKSQAEDYRKACIEEFRDQLEVFSALLLRVIPALFREFLLLKLDSLRVLCLKMNGEVGQSLQGLEEEKKTHESELRPILGHPNNADRLAGLEEKESRRVERVVDAIESHHTQLLMSVDELSGVFMVDLRGLTESSLRLLDDCVTTTDVQVVKTTIKKKSTKELIKEAKATQNQDGDDSAGSKVPLSGSNTWPGLPADGFQSGKASPSKKATKSIKTKKTTSFHQSVVHARDAIYEEYLTEHKAQVAEAESKKLEAFQLKQQWSDTWSKAIAGVSGLY
eukprot:m.12399 g.12399  ORF g.12399 m.12399 type:complete len:1507 (+) comp24025_c0_seq1:45-4565(+)